MPVSLQVEQLKARLAGLSVEGRRDGSARFQLGMQAADEHLDPGLCAFSLHDIHAETGADAAAANAFALGLAMRAAHGRPIVWILQEMAAREAGQIFGPGLHELGLDPATMLLVRVKSTTALLAAGEDALRCAAAGAVLISGWGETHVMNLTASRRLSIAAQDNRTTALMIRIAARPAPSAAATRWSVRSVLSEGLEAGAPGRPAFAADLLRSRSGARPRRWIMEWDREALSFVRPAPLSVGVVPLSAHRPMAERELPRTG